MCVRKQCHLLPPMERMPPAHEGTTMSNLTLRCPLRPREAHDVFRVRQSGEAEPCTQPCLPRGAPIMTGGRGSLFPALCSGIPRGRLECVDGERIYTRARPTPQISLPRVAGSGTAPTGSAYAHARTRAPLPHPCRHATLLGVPTTRLALRYPGFCCWV